MSATSATSTSWSCDIYLQIVPFTGDCKIRFLCLLRKFHFRGSGFFGWWPNKFIYSRKQTGMHIISSVQLDCLHTLKTAVRCHKQWHVDISLNNIHDRNRQVTINSLIDYWSTKLFFCTPWYGQKWPPTVCIRFINSYILLTMKRGQLIVRTDYIRCNQS